MAGMIITGGSADQILTNIGLIRPDGQITTAALILFAKSIQRFLPTYTARCICFIGNSIGGTQFRDKLPDSDLEGNILVQYKGIMSFLKRNLLNVQTESEFNSPGSAEISYVSLVEYIVNTLVHKSLILNMPVRVFIFDDRVEIHTPGVLPHSLGIEDIKRGISMPRNTLLFQNAIMASQQTMGQVRIDGGTLGSTATKSVTQGSSVTINAVPLSGDYRFSSWSDGSTDAARELTVNDNITLSASFETSE